MFSAFSQLVCQKGIDFSWLSWTYNNKLLQDNGNFDENYCAKYSVASKKNMFYKFLKIIDCNQVVSSWC